MKKYLLAIAVLLFFLSTEAMAQPGTPAATMPATALATTSATQEAGTTRTDARGIEQVWVPAGCFTMGSADPDGFAGLTAPKWASAEKASEQPAHQTCLTSGYWIDKTEVTNAAFKAFVDDGGYQKTEYWSADGLKWLQKQKVNQLPVTCVKEELQNPRVCITWYEAEAYAHWRGGRLPTEAEWEFAARGPESHIFPWGNTWDSAKANLVEATGPKPVGAYPEGASWVGALDMAGNAMEWVNDWLGTTYYKDAPRDNPPGPATGQRKVEKGGWWGGDPFVARSAYRHFEDPPTYQDHHIGVRIVSDVR